MRISKRPDNLSWMIGVLYNGKDPREGRRRGKAMGNRQETAPVPRQRVPENDVDTHEWLKRRANRASRISPSARQLLSPNGVAATPLNGAVFRLKIVFLPDSMPRAYLIEYSGSEPVKVIGRMKKFESGEKGCPDMSGIEGITYIAKIGRGYVGVEEVLVDEHKSILAFLRKQDAADFEGAFKSAKRETPPEQIMKTGSKKH